MDDVLNFSLSILIPDSDLQISNTLFSYRVNTYIMKDYPDFETRMYSYDLWHNISHKVYWFNLPVEVYNHREYLKLKYG